MSFWRHYFSLFRVKQRRAMLLNFVPVLCLIGLLQSPILLVRGEPQLGVPFPDGKTIFFFKLQTDIFGENIGKLSVKRVCVWLWRENSTVPTGGMFDSLSSHSTMVFLWILLMQFGIWIGWEKTCQNKKSTLFFEINLPWFDEFFSNRMRISNSTSKSR